jgi:hypothetical protein
MGTSRYSGCCDARRPVAAGSAVSSKANPVLVSAFKYVVRVRWKLPARRTPWGLLERQKRSSK